MCGASAENQIGVRPQTNPGSDPSRENRRLTPQGGSMLKVAMFVACAAFGSLAAAQGSLTMAAGGEKHWPVVQEGKTVKISPHVYIIPDGLVPQVPNVGIVVGSNATMVIDPGLGFLSGQAIAKEVGKVSKNSTIYVVNTHFHPEHTTGDVAFPTAK